MTGVALEGEGLSDKADEAGEDQCVRGLRPVSDTDSPEQNQVSSYAKYTVNTQRIFNGLTLNMEFISWETGVFNLFE